VNREVLKRLLLDVFTPLETEGINKRLLRYVTGEVGDYLGVTGGRIWERKDGYYQLVDQVGSNGNKLGFQIPDDHPYVKLIQDNEYILCRSGDECRDSQLEDDLGIGDFAAVPIGPDAKYLAAFDITIDTRKARVQRGFLDTVSAISTTALTEAERISTLQHEKGQTERELELAYRTQTGILPQSQPEIEGYDIYGVSKPIKSRKIGVGGDYYSVEQLYNGDVEITIGDVAGKGVVAARLARDLHVAKRALRDVCISGSCPHKFEPNMVELMNRMNSVLYENAESVNGTGKFMTFFYGSIDRDGGIKFVNAGHNRPLLLHDDNFEELSGGGPPLAVLPDFKYKGMQSRMHYGDFLVMFTDGITEAEDWDGNQFGDDRLKETVYANRFGTSEEMTGALLEAVKKHRRRAPKNDDRTLLTVKKIR